MVLYTIKQSDGTFPQYEVLQSGESVLLESKTPTLFFETEEKAKSRLDFYTEKKLTVSWKRYNVVKIEINQERFNSSDSYMASYLGPGEPFVRFPLKEKQVVELLIKHGSSLSVFSVRPELQAIWQNKIALHYFETGSNRPEPPIEIQQAEFDYYFDKFSGDVSWGLSECKEREELKRLKEKYEK